MKRATAPPRGRATCKRCCYWFTLLSVLGLFVLGAVLVLNASFMTSHQIRVEKGLSAMTQAFQEDKLTHSLVVSRLAQFLTFRTISHADTSKNNASGNIAKTPRIPADPPAVWKEAHAFLARSFPLVHSRLVQIPLSTPSLLFEWTGTSGGYPILLMSHMDVVPVAEPEDQWKYGPFSGTTAGGFIWGRGALDVKSGVMSILESVEYLLSQNFVPTRTIFLAFGHDEEVGGVEGAARIAALLQARGVYLDFVMDEGGMISEGMMELLPKSISFVGISEKGKVSLDLSVEMAGGHSSMPGRETTIGVLSKALAALEVNQMPALLNGPFRTSLEYLAPEMSFGARVLMGNLWLFSPMLEWALSSKPSSDASIRTTTAITVIRGGDKDNVLPSHASAIVNFRVLPGNTIQQVIDHVHQAIGDSRVAVSIYRPEEMAEPSPISAINSDGWRVLTGTIAQVYNDTLTSPYLTMAGTDSRHFYTISNSVYRFMPYRLNRAGLELIHGMNERIGVADYLEMIPFFLQLIQNAASA